MGHSILKVNKDGKDLYLLWSSIVDAPLTCGLTFDEMKKEVLKRYGEQGYEFSFKKMLENARDFGTSSKEDVESFIFCNRAGANESELTLGEIVDIFCPNDESREANPMQRLAEIKARAEAATPGPWEAFLVFEEKNMLDAKKISFPSFSDNYVHRTLHNPKDFVEEKCNQCGELDTYSRKADFYFCSLACRFVYETSIKLCKQLDSSMF